MKARTNAEWLIALKSDGQAQAAALSDLRAYLLRAALYALYRSRSTLRLSRGALALGRLAQQFQTS
jgi:hypothetical protein